MKTTLLLKFKDKKWCSQSENDVSHGLPVSPLPDDAVSLLVSPFISWKRPQTVLCKSCLGSIRLSLPEDTVRAIIYGSKKGKTRSQLEAHGASRLAFNWTTAKDTSWHAFPQAFSPTLMKRNSGMEQSECLPSGAVTYFIQRAPHPEATKWAIVPSLKTIEPHLCQGTVKQSICVLEPKLMYFEAFGLWYEISSE